MKTIDINEKQNIQYCISNELRDIQIGINLKKVKGRLEPDSEMKNEPIAIVCFGPSLKQEWEKLKEFKNIMTCSGAHKFLSEKGIIPRWHVDLEPREHKIKMLGVPNMGTEYLLASTVHPLYFDQLEGYNVKLWHIFANDEEAVRVLPKGEWALTGGSSVGLRCMTIARFLGYTDLHIFGMDGSFQGEDSHTTFHPNAPKEQFETEYNGKKYITTPSILFCAKETFHELDQMKDVRATFYGDGLVQDMAKDYKPKRKSANIAFKAPELISREYVELNSKLHQDNPHYGMGGSKYADTVLKLSEANKTHSILDYGCGKGMLAKSLPFSIWEYDPAIPEKSSIPKPADIVVCTDVLEHIEPDRLEFVLDDLRRCVKNIGYFVISTRSAVKKYANGKNAHLIVKDQAWWGKQLAKYFNVASIQHNQDASELHVVVNVKKEIQPDVTVVEKDGFKYKFYTPNETTKWRAKTLFTKEPSTIEWINGMKKGETLFDVGANIGSYSVVAGVKGVKVFSFEPEAENYALLVKNMLLNGLDPNAYCVAISDKHEIGTLYAGQAGVGGACHTFNQAVGHDLVERKPVFTQGCLGVLLDDFKDFHPDHIKIDVDGLEHKVIGGASNIIANGIKSILVEINPELPQHMEMIDKLKANGFEYDEVQVEIARRKEGTFKGCAEYIFYKKKQAPLEKHIVKRVKDTELKSYPFNHICVDNIFTDNIYKKLLDNLPKEYIPIEKSRGTKGYPQRFTGYLDNEFLKEIGNQLLSGHLLRAIVDKFGIVLSKYLTEDICFIRDLTGYSIPPHTDSTTKVISALFYLPSTEIENEGTRMYIPKEDGFICKTGRHYNFDDFIEVREAPFKPNSVFIFQRTDNSFHGVPPTTHERNVLLYNIKTNQPC